MEKHCIRRDKKYGRHIDQYYSGYERRTVDAFVKKAEEFDHPLLEREVKPCALVSVSRDESGNGVVSAGKILGKWRKSF